MPRKKNEETCQHINKQHYNAKGKLEDLQCDLPEGHKGDHHATYSRLIPDPLTDAKGIVIKEYYNEEEAEAFWGDAAGTPTSGIKPADIPQMTDYQKDLVMAVLKRDPTMQLEKAVEVAKTSGAWNALS